MSGCYDSTVGLWPVGREGRRGGGRERKKRGERGGCCILIQMIGYNMTGMWRLY